jgi:glutaredoxin
MDYFLFTYPSCQKCEKIKKYLKEISLPFSEHNLVERESKLKIREFLGDIKRDESGAIIIPTLIALEPGGVAAVLNSAEDVQTWLRSRA